MITRSSATTKAITITKSKLVHYHPTPPFYLHPTAQCMQTPYLPVTPKRTKNKLVSTGNASKIGDQYVKQCYVVVSKSCYCNVQLLIQYYGLDTMTLAIRQLQTCNVTSLSSTMISFVRKSAPIVALYWWLNFWFTNWLISDVLPTLHSNNQKQLCPPAYKIHIANYW